MAACAISNTTSSGWCAKRWPSARCCCGSRRTSSGRCASCCRTMPGLRPAWLLRLGPVPLRPSRRRARSCRRRATLDLAHRPGRPAAQAAIPHGFEYSDCWVDDARLVVLNARDAAERGAEIRTRTRVHARRARRWHGSCVLRRSGRRDGVTARVLVNAAGPWVGRRRARRCCGRRGRATCGWSRAATSSCRSSSTTTAPTSSRTPTAASSSPSPIERDFTLIGTTDEDFTGDPAAVATSAGGDRLSLPRGQRVFPQRRSTPADIVWAYAGVRPLYDDGARKAAGSARATMCSTLDERTATAPLLTVFGGKITTYRRLAEAALDELAPHLSASAAAVDRGSAAARRRFPADGVRGAGRAGSCERYAVLCRAKPARAWSRAYGTRLRTHARRRAQRCDDLGASASARL